VASTNGLVFYTTFKPYVNECSVGGQTKVWAVNYCNGGPGGTLLQGQVLAEVSTGAIAQINLATDMTGNSGRSTVISTPGAPPTGQGLAVFLTPPPIKRVLQMRER
jgi:type IV pilus assembly protein PilY1